METHPNKNRNNNGEDKTVATIKNLRSRLESRIETQHKTQLDLLASLQDLVPNIVSSLDLSLQIVSSFNNKPFTPTPPLPASTSRAHLEIGSNSRNPNDPRANIDSRPEILGESSKLERKDGNFEGDGAESGSPLAVVRVMVAECLLQRVPFNPIDSSTVLRKLENDQNATEAEKAAIREVGGESGAILAVEMALRSMAEENRGIELEEFVVSGKSRVMVLNIDRNRLVKELPESAQYTQNLELSGSGDFNQNQSSGIGNNVNSNGGVDVNGNGVYGIGGPVVMQRPLMGDMWMGGGGDMWPRGGMMGPRGMMMGPRGMMQRPPMPLPMQSQQQKQRSEEDEMKDLEALLNKKSFREMQKSKTGEELLDLIHRPTARETAVAAKFKTKGGSQLKEYCSALTKEDCRRQCGSFIACEKVHFRRIIAPHTDVSQGDCSFLDTCRHMKTCKYVHYELAATLLASSRLRRTMSPP